MWSKIDQKSWYSEHISVFEKPILDYYILSVEKQIQEGIDTWKDRLKSAGHFGDPDTEYYQEISAVDGLDDMTFSLESIFGEYFPQLQRQSALIVLYSFLERELLHLCELCRKSYNASLKAKDLCRDGSDIARYHIYLEKVIGLGITKDDPKWQEIDHGIRIVRNQIVHHEGRVPEDTNSKDYKKLESHAKSLEKCKLISIDGESIVINNGYLKYTLDTFNEFFKSFDSAISAKSGNGN